MTPPKESPALETIIALEDFANNIRLLLDKKLQEVRTSTFEKIGFDQITERERLYGMFNPSTYGVTVKAVGRKDNEEYDVDYYVQMELKSLKTKQ